MAWTTGVYCDCVHRPLAPNSASFFTPSFSMAAKMGVLAVIVEGRSAGTTNTPWRSFPPGAFFLNHSIAGVTDLKSRTPVPLYGQFPANGMTAYEIGEHCSTGSVCRTARSRMPVATPALALQPSAG